MKQITPDTVELTRAFVATINRINTNYGRGDIIAINEKKHCVTVKRQYGIEYPRYRFDGKFVYFRGVKRSLDYGRANRMYTHP